MPPQTLVLDSSQLSTLLECEERWRLENAENLIHINKTHPEETNRPNDLIAAGSLGHKYLELYYRTLGLTQDGKEAAAAALSFDPDKADETDSHSFPLDTDLRKKVRNRFCDYLMTYAAQDYAVCTRREPAIGLDGDGNLADIFKYTPLVEQGFSYKLYESQEYLFVLEGRIDLIAEAGGQTLWMDHKFQFRERELYKKSIQFRNYALATGLDLGVINYVRMTKEVGPKTFCRQPISFSTMERRLWKQELIEICIDLKKKISCGELKQNFGACGGKFGYECEFTPLCEEWNPATREAVKVKNFTRRKEWKPW